MTRIAQADRVQETLSMLESLEEPGKTSD